VKEKFQTILCALIANKFGEPIAGIRIADQFRPAWGGPEATWRNLNAAFLMALAEESHPGGSEGARFVHELERDPACKDAAAFYQAALSLIPAEIEANCEGSPSFQEHLNQLSQWVQNSHRRSNLSETIDRVWRVFFPEGVSLFQGKERGVQSLRNKRRIRITRLNPEPIQDPAREILFASNVLLTTPPDQSSPQGVHLSKALKERLSDIAQEPQQYWYDHPVPVGVGPEHNEVVHGLVGLDRAVSFEKARGGADKDARVRCILSISCTHGGLQDIGRAYLEEALGAVAEIRHLDIYAMAEADVRRLTREILVPAAARYMGARQGEILYDILGVDGEYGRHYTFLKAMAAFWHVLIDATVRGTFKIDLDQAFPQEELVEETGGSAFDHFRTPLWGAEGVDWQGNGVCLGMLAGALVNESDIHRSLFTPDVSMPDSRIHAEEWIFFSRLPQAISTQAEMMTRYGDEGLDGRTSCIQRVHVTGGTCGILVDSLRRYRPFTPRFVGRAEDQAYLLSVLFSQSQKHLRYVHKDGFFMRHDKDLYAGEAIRAAATGKLVGDYARTLVFSSYGNALPWSVQETKELMDPFTGCFITPIPLTVVCLRLALQAASLFDEGKDHLAQELLEMGTRRLWKIVRRWNGHPAELRERYAREKEGWDFFYDILDRVEAALTSCDPFALRLQDGARGLMESFKIHVPGS